jgi:hypothetical protein
MTKLSRIVATTAAAFIVAVGASAQPEHTQTEARTIEGAWRVQITPAQLHVGAAAAESVPRPGLVCARRHRHDCRRRPEPRDPNHRTGRVVALTGGTYAAVTEAFLFAPTGVNTGTQRITQHIELDPYEDTFEATVNSTVLDTLGNVVAVGCATWEASA